MGKLRNFIRLFTLAVAVLAVIGCAGGVKIRPEKMESAAGISGKYTLILYVRHSYGIDSEAFLDLEGDDYEIKLRTHPNRVRVFKGLTVEEAQDQAHQVLGKYRTISRTAMRKLSAPDGTLIGYELKPIYTLYYYGETTTYDTYFVLEKDNTLRVYFRSSMVSSSGGTGVGLD